MSELIVAAAMIFAATMFFVCLGASFLALTVWLVARLLRSADKTRPKGNL